MLSRLIVLHMEAPGPHLGARQGIARDLLHARAEGRHRIQPDGDLMYDLRIGAFAELNLDVHFIHQAPDPGQPAA